MGRRNKNITKTELYDVFRNHVQSGDTHISISTIVDQANMSRKTFYNHFLAGRDELAAWGFRRDLTNALLEVFDEDELIDPPDDMYAFEGVPCYCRTPVGTFKLDQSLYFSILKNVFFANTDYYRTLLRSEFGNPLCLYIANLFRGLFLEDIEYILNGRRMPEEAKDFIALFFAEGIAHYISDLATGAMNQTGGISEIVPVNNVIHESMSHIVDAYQEQKSSQYFNKKLLL